MGNDFARDGSCFLHICRNSALLQTPRILTTLVVLAFVIVFLWKIGNLLWCFCYFHRARQSTFAFTLISILEDFTCFVTFLTSVTLFNLRFSAYLRYLYYSVYLSYFTYLTYFAYLRYFRVWGHGPQETFTTLGVPKCHFPRFPGALSICLEKPVVPVGNQMERAFPLEIFQKKRNTFRGIPLFSPVFPNKWKAPQRIGFIHSERGKTYVVSYLCCLYSNPWRQKCLQAKGETTQVALSISTSLRYHMWRIAREDKLYFVKVLRKARPRWLREANGDENESPSRPQNFRPRRQREVKGALGARMLHDKLTSPQLTLFINETAKSHG